MQMNTSTKERKQPDLLAWCSAINNEINVIDIETRDEYCRLDGVELKYSEGDLLPQLKEIPNTGLLISLNHDPLNSANFEVFEVFKDSRPKKVYSFEEIRGTVGVGDVPFNARRSIFGVIPLQGKISYHVFEIDPYNFDIFLRRKTKWHRQYTLDSCINSFDFDTDGKVAASIDYHGACLISDIDTNNYLFHLKVGAHDNIYMLNRCRWSSDSADPILFVKYEANKLNIIDAEKQVLALKEAIQLEFYRDCCTYWIDVGPIDGSLLASGGSDRNIKIYDRRDSKLVKSFDNLHLGRIRCVRWSPEGRILASASEDKTVNLLDFGTGKIIHTEAAPNQSLSYYITLLIINISLCRLLNGSRFCIDTLAQDSKGS